MKHSWPPPWATAKTSARTTPAKAKQTMCPAGRQWSFEETGTKCHLCETCESECLTESVRIPVGATMRQRGTDTKEKRDHSN